MRASRLLAIMILLQLRPRLTAADLAAEFEVSLRTIYRDIDALSAAGVPIYGDRGPGGGFQLLDGYRTRLTGLSTDEAEALPLIGLPGPAAELGWQAAASGARRKVIAALPGEGAAQADRVAACFHVDPLNWYAGSEALPHLPALVRAVIDRRRIAMRYAGWRGAHDWTVEPLGLVLKGGAWYLAASGRGKVRVFKVSQVERLAVGEDGFDRPAGFDLAAWWRGEQARFEAELFSETATLRASPLGCERLCAQSPRGARAVAEGQLPAADGWRTLSMLVEDSDHGARDMLALGAEVEVLAPAAFRQRIAAIAEALAALHRQVG